MWAKTTTGGILIAPRMHDAEGLYSGLAATNPGAGISTPTPNGWWPFARSEGVNWIPKAGWLYTNDYGLDRTPV